MNKKLFLGLFAFCSVATATVSCSSDEPATTPDNGDGNTYYLRVNVCDVNTGSKAANDADHFEDGVGDENTINSLQFKFYDASGTAIKAQTVTNHTFENATPGQGNPSVGKIQESIVEVQLSQGQNLPSYVICSANPINWTAVEGQDKMADLRNLERNGFKAGNYYTMNNSVYYGTDAVSGQTNVKITGTPITAGQLFTSKADAEAATGGSVVDIYIERMASKVKLTVADDIASQTVDGYTLTFTPESWTVTADANSMYSVKRFSTDAASDGVIPTLTEVNAYLGGGWNDSFWNDAPLFRSYWACSPSFYGTNFPRVSDDIMDKATADQGTGAGTVVAPFSLKYYSYNQVKGANGTTIAANGAESIRYQMENTMGKAGFASVNPNAAAPSVLIVGNYSIDGIAANTSFSIWNNKLYFLGNTIPAGAQAGAQTLMDAMLAAQSIIAIDDQGSKLTSVPAGVTMEITHPAANIRADQALAENLVTLQVTNAGNQQLYYSPNGTDEWEPIDSDDELAYVNKQLAGQLNYAKAYTNGKAYYGIPIQHLRATEDTTNSPFSTNADGTTNIDWAKVRIGDFGLVRNHVYTINVTNIKGFGSGIFNLDAPIVTPMDTYNYYIKYSIRVLNWRIVPTQGVIL